MRRPLPLSLFMILALSANAQVISEQPLCVKIFNATDGAVPGHVETAEHYDENGDLSWHRSNFRLEPNHEQDVCSSGPFFEGYKLRVVIKSIIPLYSCLTEMNRTVTISYQSDETRGRELVMDCPSERAE